LTCVVTISGLLPATVHWKIQSRACSGCNQTIQTWHQSSNGSQRKDAFFAAVPEAHRLRVGYYDLLKDSSVEAQKIAAFLELKPSAEQFNKAEKIVHLNMQHVGTRP